MNSLGVFLRSRALLTLASLAGAAFLAFHLAGANLKGSWVIIDDHEIMQFLGADQRLTWSEVPGQLLATEVGKPGESVRYRPFYYLLRLGETTLWGSHIRLWNMARLTLLALSIWLLWWLLKRSGDALLAAGAVMLIFTQEFWPRIWCHLGTAEIYTVPASLLCLAGCALAARRTVSRPVVWGAALAILAGGLAAAGSKENFLILGLPALCAAGYRWQRDGRVWRQSWPIHASVVLLLLFMASLALVLIAALHAAGADVYGVSARPADRMDALVTSILRRGGILPLSVLAAPLLWAAGCRVARRRPGPSGAAAVRLLGWTTAGQVGLCIGYGWQMLYYNGQLPAGTRYDYPSELLPTVSVVLWIVVIARLVPLVPALKTSAAPRSRALSRILTSTAGLILMAVALHRGYGPFREYAGRYVQVSNAFYSSFQSLVSTAQTHPQSSILIENHGIEEYEPVVSLARFLRAYGVNNPLFLRIGPYPYRVQDPLERDLAARLNRLQRRGGEGYSPSAQNHGPPGLIVTFRGRAPATPGGIHKTIQW
jgi:hypothetical protein